MVSLIYGFLCSLTVVFIYFFLPETRGRSLEEIVYMFENKVPTRHWDEYDTSKMTVPNEKRQRFSGDVPEHLENLENKEHDNKLLKLENA